AFEHEVDPEPTAHLYLQRAMQIHTRDTFERTFGPVPVRNRVTVHGPLVHRRSAHRAIVEAMREEFALTSASRFRTAKCMCMIQIAYPQYALFRGLARQREFSWFGMNITSNFCANRAGLRLIEHVRSDVFTLHDEVEG